MRVAQESKILLRINPSETFRFTPQMLSAKIVFNNLDTYLRDAVGKKLRAIGVIGSSGTSIVESFDITTTSFQTSITAIENSTVAQLYDKISVSVTIYRNSIVYITTFIAIDEVSIPFTITVNEPPTLITTEKTKSFAKIKFQNLNVFSGEVDAVEIYSRPSTRENQSRLRKNINQQEINSQQYKLISTQQFVQDELFTDVTGNITTELDNINKINTSFETSSFSGTSVAPSQFTTFTKSDEYKLNGLLLELNSDLTKFDTDYVKIAINPEIIFLKDNEYIFSFDIFGEKISDTFSEEFKRGREVPIEIYASGSSFDNGIITTNTHIKRTLSDLGYDVKQNYIFGELLGRFIIPQTLEQRNFGNVSVSFKPRYDGTAKIVLVLNWGKWNIANISIGPKNKEQLTLTIPIKDGLEKNRAEVLDFKFVYKNADSIKAFTTTEKKFITFDGENDVVEGQNNLLAGSMYIGNVVGSGIQMAGVASGFIRSVGYTGYESASLGKGAPGFIIYSGSSTLSSVLSASDNYEGVGLELHAGGDRGRLRFKASGSNSIFEVIANAFFVGSTGSQFISGSGGNIEISSSHFHLSPDGNVTMTGAITASAGYIGGFTINTSSLSSTNIFISGSPLAGGIDNSSYMFISTSNFNVKQNGDITGSQVLFSGGTIAGFTIDSNKIRSTNMIISSSGVIQTADFTSSLLGAGKGWRISESGKAEFENANIRGTLATAVFEKNTISAVGGQVIIANATTISGSDVYYTPTSSIIVDGASGFAIGEYLVAKATGSGTFTREYMRVDSIDLLSQTLVVHRNKDGNYIPTMSIGQVIVSQGVSGSGYIHMNASPTDLSTPYIDIAQRTGSGVNDVARKTRLGNLGGLAGTSFVFNNPNPGFGLASENVFLTGRITAESGYIGTVTDGWTINSRGIFTTGSSGVGLELTTNSSKSITTGFSVWNPTSPKLFVGNPTSFMDWNNTTANELYIKGNINATTGSFSGGVVVDQAGSIYSSNFLDSTSVYTTTSIDLTFGVPFVATSSATTSGSYQVTFHSEDSPSANIYLVTLISQSVSESITNVTYANSSYRGIASSSFIPISASVEVLSPTSSITNFALSKVGTGFKLQGDGTAKLFQLEVETSLNATSGVIGGFTIESNGIYNGKTSIDSTVGGIWIGSSTGISMGTSGSIPQFKVTTGGELTATLGYIGGFAISDTKINSTNNNIILSSSGQLIAQDATINGIITAQGGSIGGFALTQTAISSSDGKFKIVSAPSSSIQFYDSFANKRVQVTVETSSINITTPANALSGNYYLYASYTASGAVWQQLVGSATESYISRSINTIADTKFTSTGLAADGVGGVAAKMILTSSNFNVAANSNILFTLQFTTDSDLRYVEPIFMGV